MKNTRRRRPGRKATAGWSRGLSVRVGGTGTIAHAGIVLPRLLADRTGLTAGLAADMHPARDRKKRDEIDVQPPVLL